MTKHAQAPSRAALATRQQLTDIVRVCATLPCICHPLALAQSKTCLGDDARKILGLPPWERNPDGTRKPASD